MPNLLNKLKIKFSDCDICIRHLTCIIRIIIIQEKEQELDIIQKQDIENQLILRI